MSFIYRKPKNHADLVSILDKTKSKVDWNFIKELPDAPELKNKFFELFLPMTLIFNGEKLIGLAHLNEESRGGVYVYSPDNKGITDTFTNAQLKEISINLRQIELF